AAPARGSLQRYPYPPPIQRLGHRCRLRHGRIMPGTPSLMLPPSALTLPVFSQLLEPAGLAPALDFRESGVLVYTELPTVDCRSRVRFVVGDGVAFRAGTN